LPARRCDWRTQLPAPPPLAGIALINSMGNLGGFVGPYAIGWIKDATGETTLGLVVLATCSIMAGVVSIMAGVVTFLIGHDSKIEMAGSRMMAE
jgi:ACS family tartrate transporter-like MFS transporter